jgi:hypothetical protein
MRNTFAHNVFLLVDVDRLGALRNYLSPLLTVAQRTDDYFEKNLHLDSSNSKSLWHFCFPRKCDLMNGLCELEGCLNTLSQWVLVC